MTITIDLGDGRTATMTPPAALGAAFTAVIADALNWDDTRRDEVEALRRAARNEAMDDASDMLSEAWELAGLQWSCQFGEPDEPPEAGPYTETLSDHGMAGAADVADAVLSRDLGIITAEDFATLTGWWVAAGLPLPEPRPGATFAEDYAEVERRATKVGRDRYHVPGWPLAAA